MHNPKSLTHYACDDRLELYGPNTSCCACIRHECKWPGNPIVETPSPTPGKEKCNVCNGGCYIATKTPCFRCAGTGEITPPTPTPGKEKELKLCDQCHCMTNHYDGLCGKCNPIKTGYFTPPTPSGAGEEHEIKTLQDILQAVNANNQEAFLTDFGAFLAVWCTTKTMVDLTNPESMEKTVESVRFKWIDDGKHEASINVEVHQV